MFVKGLEGKLMLYSFSEKDSVRDLQAAASVSVKQFVLMSFRPGEVARV